jgi:mRNA interferase RelE/StbE
MKIIQSGAFERKVKKLSARQKSQLDDAIRTILKNPFSGELKRGDFKTVYIHKFYIDKTLYLLAYSISTGQLELIMLGPHENYYSQLKNYLKKR